MCHTRVWAFPPAQSPTLDPCRTGAFHDEAVETIGDSSGVNQGNIMANDAVAVADFAGVASTARRSVQRSGKRVYNWPLSIAWSRYRAGTI